MPMSAACCPIWRRPSSGPQVLWRQVVAGTVFGRSARVARVAYQRDEVGSQLRAAGRLTGCGPADEITHGLLVLPDGAKIAPLAGEGPKNRLAYIDADASGTI